jgi:hypothetical protein
MEEEKKCKRNFNLITYEIMNMKWSVQGHGARLYFKLILNKLNVNHKSTINLITSLL